ncbi:MAG: PaaI family thioesterase [Pseudomonadota bacterium]|nr:PaaI family thioesterase [Pseudomonadota bacterium]
MVHNLMQHPGFAELVGFEVFPESDGTGKGQLIVSERHLNPNGVVHGGALFTLVDTAMGASLMQRLDEGEICATLQISMNFLRPVLGGMVECEARVVNKGRRFANVRGELYVEDKLVGTADGNFAIMQAP